MRMPVAKPSASTCLGSCGFTMATRRRRPSRASGKARWLRTCSGLSSAIVSAVTASSSASVTSGKWNASASACPNVARSSTPSSTRLVPRLPP